MTQEELIRSYYVKRPGVPIPTSEVVDWAIVEWLKEKKKPLRDPDRAIRKLAQSGALVKISKGVYKYDPGIIKNPDVENFTSKQKEIIMKRDNYVCAVCGLGKKNGVEIHVDHIKPKEFGGKACLGNGQLLCGRHNNLKKTYSQTEFGKRIFIKLHRTAVASGDSTTENFCTEVLEVYEKYDIDGNIAWRKEQGGDEKNNRRNG